MKYLSLFILLTTFHSTISAQASWSYSLWFTLTDENGATISKEEFIDRNIKVLTAPLGAHAENSLTYDEGNQSFLFSQGTITTSSILLFVHDADTTTLFISTQDLFLKDVPLTGKRYHLSPWKHPEQFLCTHKLPNNKDRRVCIHKKPVETYEVEENSSFAQITFNHLETDPLEIVYLEGIDPEDFFKREKLTKSLKGLIPSNIKAIYPIASNTFLIAQAYVSGSGNHYYDYVSLRYVRIEEDQITYLPFDPISTDLWHHVDEAGCLIFEQHQSLSEAPMQIFYDPSKKTIEYQYSHYASISDSDEVILVKGAYLLQNGKLTPLNH